MSEKYSTSPILRLRIGESATLRLLVFAFCLLLATALAQLACTQHALLAATCTAALLAMQVCTRQRSLHGAVLCWQAGRWTLEEGVVSSELEVQRAHCLPWLTYLQWRETGGRVGRVWLFLDAAELHQLRRLRVRLLLERGT